MKVYEITYLTESEESIDAKIVSSVFADNKAKIVSVHPWGGRRRLVYPIKKQDQAFFTTVVFEADPAALAPMNRALQLNTAILRSLVVEYEPGYFERMNAPQTDESELARTKDNERAKEPVQAADAPETEIPTAPEKVEAEVTPVILENTAEPESTVQETATEEKEATSTESAESETTEPKKTPVRRTKKTQKTEGLDEKLDALLKEDITQ